LYFKVEISKLKKSDGKHKFNKQIEFFDAFEDKITIPFLLWKMFDETIRLEISRANRSKTITERKP